MAARSEFAGRKATKTIAGQPVDGWFAEDFTLAEIETLFAREPDPAAHPQNARLGGKEPVLGLPDVLQIARDGCVRTGRTIGVCLQLSHPARYADFGLDVVGRLADELNTEGYVAPAAAIWVQAFETDALRAFGRLSRVRRMLLIDAGQPDIAAMTASAGLGDIKALAEAIGPQQDLLIDPAAATFPAPTTLALDAHAAGLAVFSRSAKAQNAALPPALRRGDARSPGYPNGRGDVGKLLVALFSDAVDGVATDLPAEAARARGQAMSAIRRARSRGDTAGGWSENREPSGAGHPTSPHGRQRRRLLPGDCRARRSLRRAPLHRRQDDRHLLPADLPGAHAQARELRFLPDRRGRAGGRASARACAAGRRPRPTSAPGAARPTPCRGRSALIEVGALDEADVDGLGRAARRR